MLRGVGCQGVLGTDRECRYPGARGGISGIRGHLGVPKGCWGDGAIRGCWGFRGIRSVLGGWQGL